MKVLLLSSSSGGHIYPSLEVGNYLEMKGIEVNYLGFKNQMEEKIISKEKLITIDCKNSFSKVVFNPKEIVKLIKEIKRIKKYKFDLFLGFGGFITIISLFIKNKKPLLIHEQNTTLGDSNKLVRLFSNKVLYSFDTKDKKGLVVGNPRGENIIKKPFIYKNKFNILFIFGSLGSSSLLDKLLEEEEKLSAEHSYVIVTGSKLFLRYKDKFRKIKVKEFISLKEEIKEYDIIFSRGGATTLYEIISSNTYCISIPSPYVKNNHQEKNVDYLLDKALIRKLDEKNFNSSNINKEINTFYDFEYCLSKYKNMNDFTRLNTCEMIYQEIKRYDKN